MRSKLAALLLFACAPLTLLAQGTLSLQFDQTRDVVAFASSRHPAEVPKDATSSQGPTLSLSVPPTGTLYVWDRGSGNMAAKPLGKTGPILKLRQADFNLIGLATVRVVREGVPVAAARVTLKDKVREQSRVIDSSSNGEAEFYAVVPGETRVTVEYKSEGSQAEPVVQIFPLELERNQTDPVLTVSLPQPVETVGSQKPQDKSADKGKEKAKDEPKPRDRNPIGSFLVYVLALAGAIAAGYYGLLYIRNNPKNVADTLGKLGVPVPDPNAPPAAPDAGSPVAPPAPAPQQKIILDDAAPTPIDQPYAAPSATPVAASIGEPRLVKGSGEFVILDEGETVVGREDGLGLSLLGESTVSRRHASIIRQGGSVMVRDLGSTNGTFVNGRKVDNEIPLSAGDEVQFGAVKFRLEG